MNVTNAQSDYADSKHMSFYGSFSNKFWENSDVFWNITKGYLGFSEYPKLKVRYGETFDCFSVRGQK